MNNQMKQFFLQLDQLLGIHPGQINTVFTSPQDESALEIGSLLKQMDFGSELAPRTGIRSRWMSQTQAMTPPIRRLFTARTAWLAALVLALALLIAFRQPVLAAVSHLFGYVYIQDVGFLPADSTRVLQQPVRQEHAGQSLTVTRGIATLSEITLWLEYSDTARSVDGTTLTTESGSRLEVSYWEYFPNLPDTHGVVMHFPPLPMGITQTTLSLPEGWQVPLEWIPASQSHLPDVRAVPYPATIAPEATALPAVTPEQELSRKKPGEICQEKHGMQLCVLAATASAPNAGTGTTSENTSVLVQTQSLISVLSEKVWFGSIWQAGVTLSDAKGNVYPLNSYQNGTLLFPPISANQIVTLTIPAVLASLDISRQSITVDLGSDPQPNTVIPLDVTIPIMGTSVHFSKATFVGDGVSSLRLTLDADPVQSVDGITPISIEIGKPDRVDDLYGGGMLEGSKDIFVELMQPAGKITGIINIPLDKAFVTVQGPFEFSFNLPDAASISPAPALADPNTFYPAPTTTPIPLDAYAYTGSVPKSGDLLFTVVDNDKTNVFSFTPGEHQPRLVITLPGAVSQLYLHPDRLGLDYLAGIQASRDGIFYIKDLSLYSIRFDDPFPHLLYSFSPTPENTVGTTVDGEWSHDGNYAIFRYVKPLPGNDFWKFLWLDMSCRANGACIPHEIPLSSNLALYKVYFAPKDYRILFTGSDETGTGKSDLFVMNFDPKSAKNEITNITTASSNFADNLGFSPALWTPDERIFTLCSDGKMATMFCYVDPVTGKIDIGKAYTEHLLNYQLSPSGKYVLGIVINHNAPGKGSLEIHKFDLNAQAGPALASGIMFPFAAISPSDQFIAYITENSDQVQLVDSVTGKTFSVYSSAISNVATWLGWVR